MRFEQGGELSIAKRALGVLVPEEEAGEGWG